MTRPAEPDWTAMAERHEEELRRRKRLRASAAGAVAVAAVGGMLVLVVPGGSGAGPARPAAAAGSGGASATVPAEVPPSDTGETTPAAGPSGSPASPSPAASTSAPAPTGSARPAAPVTGPPASGGASSPAPAPSATPTPEKSQTSTPPPGKPYTPVQVCGSGFAVIDSHSLGAATVYLMYKGATGDNCVTTIANSPGGPVAMNATLAVKGGAATGNPGTFTYYAGPIIKRAPDTCVQWGGAYAGTSWTSGWSHCG